MSKRARMRILAELSKRDMTVADIASALGLTEGYTVECLTMMTDAAHCLEGSTRSGKYRIGQAPEGHTSNRAELTRRAILAAIGCEAKTAPEIAEITGLSESFIRVTMRGMLDRVRVITGGARAINGIVPTRYISIDAPLYVAPQAERVKLPGWAAALAL